MAEKFITTLIPATALVLQGGEELGPEDERKVATGL